MTKLRLLREGLQRVRHVHQCNVISQLRLQVFYLFIYLFIYIYLFIANHSGFAGKWRSVCAG